MRRLLLLPYPGRMCRLEHGSSSVDDLWSNPIVSFTLPVGCPAYLSLPCLPSGTITAHFQTRYPPRNSLVHYSPSMVHVSCTHCIYLPHLVIIVVTAKPIYLGPHPTCIQTHSPTHLLLPHPNQKPTQMYFIITLNSYHITHKSFLRSPSFTYVVIGYILRTLDIY